MDELAYSYAPILKYDSNDDGTVTVYGKATDETLDVDQQICDNEWLKSAMPDWFMSAGNIREMHGSTAAGVATDYEEKADGHYIRAKIVDDGSVKKIKNGVLKGFSIGIRSPRVIRDAKAAGGRIVGGQIVEVSVVDRPANPSAKMTIAKAMNGEGLMAVDQLDIPTPAEAFKSAEIVEPVEAVETVATDAVEVEAEVVVEETADKSAALLNTVTSLLKFDQATYDAACSALYDLIAIEAAEGKAGSDERDSIKELLHSIKHLYEWYEGEVAEGEVAMPNPAIADDAADYDVIELSADVEMCDKCDMAMKDCKCDSMKSADADTEVVEAEAPAVETLVEETATDEVTEEISEVDRLKSALDAEIEKATRLEAELELAKSAAVAGGPRRSAITKAVNPSEVLVKATEYRNKAAATTDRVLREGYEALAADLEKSLKGQK
jgi:hypothetical protein